MKACDVSKRGRYQGFSFCWDHCDFMLNFKFMFLHKKSIGHNAMFSREDSCQQ